jgi:hypothetical protein
MLRVPSVTPLINLRINGASNLNNKKAISAVTKILKNI